MPSPTLSPSGALSRLVLVLAALATLPVLLIQCGDDNQTVSTAPDDGNDGVSVIGPDGGTVADGDGSSVLIPAGALDSAVTITVQTLHDANDIPDSLISYAFGSSGMADFGPDGLQFNSPVTITLPVAPPLTPGDSLPLFTWDPTDLCWMSDGTYAHVNAGGNSVSAQVSHFSQHTVMLEMGGDGLFTGLTLSDDFNEIMFDFEVQWRSVDRFGKIVWGGESHGCCMKQVGIRCVMDYTISGQNNHFESVNPDPLPAEWDRLEVYEDSFQAETVDVSVSLRLEMYYRYDDVRLEMYKEPARINVAESGAYSTIEIRAYCGSNDARLIDLDFSVTGPGALNKESAETDYSGDAEIVLTASDTGMITVQADYLKCEGDPDQQVSAEIDVEAYYDNAWSALGSITFAHATDAWGFTDVVSFGFDFDIDPDGNITGLGTGTHSASVSLDDCTLLSINQPSFPIVVMGTADEEQLVLVAVPRSVEEFPIDFTMQCDDGIVSIDTYRYLEASIMGMNIIYMPERRDLGEDEGTGSESFGEDTPIDYGYQITVMAPDQAGR